MKRSNYLPCVLVTILLVISVLISCTPKSQEAIVIRHVVGPPPGDLMTVEAEEMAAVWKSPPADSWRFH